jgi:hypothetical protein
MSARPIWNAYKRCRSRRGLTTVPLYRPEPLVQVPRSGAELRHAVGRLEDETRALRRQAGVVEKLRLTQVSPLLSLSCLADTPLRRPAGNNSRRPAVHRRRTRNILRPSKVFPPSSPSEGGLRTASPRAACAHPEKGTQGNHPVTHHASRHASPPVS